MLTFNTKRYFIRAVKYLTYMVVFLFLFVSAFALMSNEKWSYEVLFRADTKWQMAGFLFFFSFIYPIFGYIKKKVYINGPFENDKEKILQVFLNTNFVLVYSSDAEMVFHHKSQFIRLMRMYEDAIVLNFSDNPITLEGQRKDIYRLARSIEYAIKTNEE